MFMWHEWKKSTKGQLKYIYIYIYICIYLGLILMDLFMNTLSFVHEHIIMFKFEFCLFIGLIISHK